MKARLLTWQGFEGEVEAASEYHDHDILLIKPVWNQLRCNITSSPRGVRNLKPSVIYHIALHPSKGNRSRISDWPLCSWTCEVLGENDTMMIPKAVKSLEVGNDKRQGQGQLNIWGGSYLAKFPGKLRIHAILIKILNVIHLGQGFRADSDHRRNHRINVDNALSIGQWASILSEWTHPVYALRSHQMASETERYSSVSDTILEPKNIEHIIQSYSLYDLRPSG